MQNTGLKAYNEFQMQILLNPANTHINHSQGLHFSSLQELNYRRVNQSLQPINQFFNAQSRT